MVRLSGDHLQVRPQRRRLGVIQITGNEPAQDTRGEVSGLSLTATWQLDPAVDAATAATCSPTRRPDNDSLPA